MAGIYFIAAVVSAKREAQMRGATLNETVAELFLTPGFHWQDILKTALNGFSIVDIEGRFLEVNEACCRILGYTRKELLSMTIADVESVESPSDVLRHIEAIKEKKTDHFVTQHRRKNGSIIEVEVNATYLDIGAGQIAFFVQDITERKRAEDNLRKSEEALRLANEQLEQRVRERTTELVQSLEALEKHRDDLRKLASELVMTEERERKRIATVLHDEIAQTLAVAKMRIDMLKGMAANEESRQTVAEAKEFLTQSIKETRALMNDVGNPLLFDMGVGAACTALADRLMASHPVLIGCDIQDSFNKLDPDVKVILYQVIRELLNNVVKHSRARNAQVLIHSDNGRIRAEVRDDGIGFDPRMLGAPTAEGGFGLFSIRERLEAFNGSLQIESKPGTGTVVTASLPAAFKER